MPRLPDKINPDAIREAVFEIRFQMGGEPEEVVGQVLNLNWAKDLKKTRLPVADLPNSLRASDENLKFQAIFELQGEDHSWLIKLGPSTISFHSNESYPGWHDFKDKIKVHVKDFLLIDKEIKILRCGLRYINGLTINKHYIKKASDLNIKVAAGNFNPQIYNLNYINAMISKSLKEKLEAMVRVASPEFVQGPEMGDFGAFIDIDVRTKFTNPKNLSEKEVSDWLEEAHKHEKEQFFNLIPANVIERLQ